MKLGFFLYKLMNIFRNLLFFSVIILLLEACSTDGQGTGTMGDVSTIIHVSSVPSLSDEDIESNLSRSVATGSGTSYQVGFQKGDTVGLFPQGGHQIDFSLPIPEGVTQYASDIIAKGWRTKSDVKYVAYGPFDYENRDASHINWDFRRIQQQSGNNTRDHLGKYWFLASDTISPTVDETGTSKFGAVLYNMGAIIRFMCLVPKKADYIRAMFVAPKAVFATHGYYDLFDTTEPKVDFSKVKYSAIPIPMKHQPFHAEEYTDHVTVDIQSASCDPNDKSKRVLQGYIEVPEVDLRGMTVTLYIWDADGNLYSGQTTLKTTQGYLSRTAIASFSFASMSPATTLNVKLNDWEKSELCDDCKPVAF